MSNVDFIGSQAFNQDNTGNESVIPNTGSLLVNLPLLKVLGIRDGIELDLTLSFSLGITGPYGLPQNWNINVPFIDADNSLHINNSRYITSTTWTDITGYPSGLQYVNNHATLFVDTQEQLPLPYGSSGEYYRYTYADPNGFVWYFNNTGQLLMKADLYANYLFYTYTTGGLLNSVVDSFEQTTTFGYGTNQLIITAPDGRTVAINYSATGVQNLVDPLGNITAFTYLQSSNFSLIQTITYPTGKITTATYTQLNYLGADGNQYPLPAISDLVYADTNGNMLGHYNYIYGEQSSGATFTGLFASYSLSAGSDGLLASNDTNYLYDVTEQMIDGSNNVLYKKDTFYNFAHVPVTENMYVIDASSGSSFLQTSTTYDMSGNQPNLQPTYLYPLQTQQDFFPSASANPVPQLLTTYSYDDYGNTLSKQVCSYASDGVTTVMQTNEVASYFTHDMSIYSLPDTVTKTDGITGQIIRTINTLTANQRDIGNSVMSSSTNGGDSWNAWKSLAKSFDTQGRIINQNYKWDVPKYSGVANASTSYAYQYNAAIFGVTTVATDAVGNKSTTVISTMYGTKLSFTKSSGKATTYTYDLIGRVLSVINPSGAQTRYAYQCFQQSGVNTVALTDAIGYITTKTYDPLGRLLQVVDNGNPITPSKARTVSTRSYDLLGNVANETDLYGNATACTYNSLRKPVSTTDPFGNKTVFAYDYTAGSTTSSVNGVACKKSVVDGLGRVILEQQFANSTRPSGSDIYTMSTERQFTGFGKTASESVSQIVGQTTNLLQTQKYVYDCDLRPFQQSFAGADGSTRTASTVFDLNGNEVATTKLTTYSGGAHYEVQSELRSYDAVSQLLAVVNAMDQKESYTYDGDGNLVKKVLPNKTSIAYAYTDDGYKSNETWQTSSDKFAIAFAYDAVGHLTATTDSSGTIGMTYALDGVPTGISYPDGKSITYGLDQYSRRASLVDAAGTTTNYSYTPTNQLSVVKNAVDTLTYDYYTDVKSNTLFGAPKSVSLGGQYIETNYYDAQNRVAKTIKLTPANKILLQEDLTYSPLNQIVTSMLSSNLNKTSSLNCSRTFTYDSLTQLIGDHLVDQAGSVMLQTSFQYDGNSNVLKKTAIDGTTTFTYNAIDQLTQYTDASGKPKMLTYGTNGELLQDGAGTNYSYDLLGRLQQTKLTEGNVAYTYYANQLMATRSGTPGTNQFYYDTQQMAVNSAKNNLLTSFLSAGTQRFTSYVSGAAQQYFVCNSRRDTVATFAPSGINDSQATYYEAYGSPVMGNCGLNSGDNFTWNQEYADIDSGLMFLRARFYDPRIMRFITRDTTLLSNRYSYCNGDPVNRVDPSGHDALGLEIGIGVGVGVTVTAAIIGTALYFGGSIAAAAGGAGALATVAAGVLAAGGVAALGAGPVAVGAIAAVASVATATLTTLGASATTGGLIGGTIGTAVGTYVGASVGGPLAVLSGGSVGGVLGAVVGNAVGDTVAAASSSIATTVSSASAMAIDGATSLAYGAAAVAGDAAAAISSTIAAAASVAAEAAAAAAAAATTPEALTGLFALLVFAFL